MREFDLVIVGGRPTAARTIKAYRDAAGAGRIALISADSTLPYHRPPLSKRYLRGAERPSARTPFVEQESFYEDNDVERRRHASGRLPRGQRRHRRQWRARAAKLLTSAPPEPTSSRR
jgi:3-phenylpropionate/trans-cinnamate dioxygenase ferredoxin reductase subunit